MTGRDLETDVRDLYAALLGREPGPAELAGWVARAGGMDFRRMFDLFCQSPEYAERNRVVPGHPVGHFYSPVVDPAVLTHFRPDRTAPPESLPGLDLSPATMLETLERLRPHLARLALAEHPAPGLRYHWSNPYFAIGDGTILSAMIAARRPTRIIEIGSGHSTACMLDAIDREGLETRLTCIEPFPDRLQAALWPQDHQRVEILAQPVQAVDPEIVRDMGPGDILFIDSTHVLKTGSDLCFELFELLPRLAPGVVVHFHDIFYPFEYPDPWIFQRRYSWNEIYALRAFLSFNRRFRVIYFNHYMMQAHAAEVTRAFGFRPVNPGGGLWLEVTDAG